MRLVRILLLILLALALAPYVLTLVYRTGHPGSTLMLWQRLTGGTVSRQWMDLAAMSPALPRSVVASEDAHFCKHHGIDFGALREAMQSAEEGEALRGASTITQQVAKNLFLWQGPNSLRKVLGPLRKLFEFPLAIWIDLVLPKPRILEIYLNIASFGPSGQFGAEAGANYAFGHSAAALSPREAALMAAILPNPVRRSARNPRAGVQRLAGIYIARANVVATCWEEKRGF